MKKKAGDAQVNMMLLDGARALVTIGPNDKYWDLAEMSKAGRRKAYALPPKGAIVRVQPPSTATDEQIAQLREWLRECAVVRVDARAPGEQIVVEKQKAKGVRQNAREVVMEMAEKSSRKLELCQLLDGLLKKVGL